MKKVSKIIFATAIMLCMAFYSNAQPMDYNILIDDIEFQPGVFIDINVNVYVNENATNWANHGKIFAIEGMAHTANCMQPLAEELFLNPPQMEINEFFAIDMPGRGLSGLPDNGNGFLLEDMYVEDYLAVIQGALEYLNNELNVYPGTIMGHSLGGLEVILLQDKLINEGTNLRKEYKIKNAVLLAPAMPAPLDWAYISGGGSSGLYAYIDYFTPEYGTVLNMPFYVWPFAFFTNTCCYFAPDMVPGAPAPGEVLANGYNSIEPAPLLLQLSGADPAPLPYPQKPRPAVDEGIFTPKNGVQLTIVADEYDKMMTPAEEEALYEYLTGDHKHKRFIEVKGEETCHDTHISDPHAIVELLDKPYIFKSSEVGEDITFTHNVKVYPNPVQSNSTIEVEFDQNANLELCIYNQVGQLIQTIYNGQMEKGNHTFQLTTEKLPVGLYTLRVQSGNKSEVIKIIKTK